MKYNEAKLTEYYKKFSLPKEFRNYVLTEIKKHYAPEEKLEILEIGNFVLDFTYDLYNTFNNATITTCDSLHDVMNKPEVILYFIENFKKMHNRVNLIITNFQESHVPFKDYYDLTVIDIGQHSNNIIEVLEKLPKSKQIFLLLPLRTESRRKERNIVLEYLNKNNRNVEILNNPWVRIYE